MLHWSGVLDELELASQLVNYANGEVRSTRPFITSTVINHLVGENQFLTEPHLVAANVARSMNSTICEDLHALPMAILTGLAQFYNLDEVACNATRICKTTHAHPRVITACTALARVVATLLQVSLNTLMNLSQTQLELLMYQQSRLRADELTDFVRPVERKIVGKHGLPRVLRTKVHGIYYFILSMGSLFLQV